VWRETKDGFALPYIGKCWRCIVHRDIAMSVALGEKKRPELRLADARGVLQYGLEHQPQFSGRRADDLQHRRCRGLLLQRLGKLARPLVELLLELG
jgi:hypothetical protein